MKRKQTPLFTRDAKNKSFQFIVLDLLQHLENSIINSIPTEVCCMNPFSLEIVKSVWKHLLFTSLQHLALNKFYETFVRGEEIRVLRKMEFFVSLHFHFLYANLMLGLSSFLRDLSTTPKDYYLLWLIGSSNSSSHNSLLWIWLTLLMILLIELCVAIGVFYY